MPITYTQTPDGWVASVVVDGALFTGLPGDTQATALARLQSASALALVRAGAVARAIGWSDTTAGRLATHAVVAP